MRLTVHKYFQNDSNSLWVRITNFQNLSNIQTFKFASIWKIIYERSLKFYERNIKLNEKRNIFKIEELVQRKLLFWIRRRKTFAVLHDDRKIKRFLLMFLKRYFGIPFFSKRPTWFCSVDDGKKNIRISSRGDKKKTLRARKCIKKNGHLYLFRACGKTRVPTVKTNVSLLLPSSRLASVTILPGEIYSHKTTISFLKLNNYGWMIRTKISLFFRIFFQDQEKA